MAHNDANYELMKALTFVKPSPASDTTPFDFTSLLTAEQQSDVDTLQPRELDAFFQWQLQYTAPRNAAIDPNDDAHVTSQWHFVLAYIQQMPQADLLTIHAEILHACPYHVHDCSIWAMQVCGELFDSFKEYMLENWHQEKKMGRVNAWWLPHIGRLYEIAAEIFFHLRDYGTVVHVASLALLVRGLWDPNRDKTATLSCPRVSDTYADLHTLRGAAHFELNQLQAATKDFSMAWQHIDARACATESYRAQYATTKSSILFILMGHSHYKLTQDTDVITSTHYGIKLQELALEHGHNYRPYEHSDLLVFRGLASYCLDRHNQCIKDLRKSIEVAPKYRPARDALKKVWDLYYDAVSSQVSASDIARVIVDFMVGDDYTYDINDGMVYSVLTDLDGLLRMESFKL